jgi:selenocysteine-specific elongation factor
MTARNFIIATAGHVDHGKSALVKALTGIDPDRLPEEKARGITIDLGFAHLEIPSAVNDPRSSFHVGIIDVPGHEDFVKNMVAGVGSIDLALIVVAADDGWMPQTEEHLQILTYLGVNRAVVALTKIDLVESEEKVVAALREKLADSPFAQAPIVPTSVFNARGFDEFKTTLARALSGMPPPKDIGKPRLPVDRVFTLRGIGTVVTGTLNGGTLHRGQPVIVQPSGKTTRIRAVQNHNRDVDISVPGTRTALNLPDVDADAVERGDVITLSELGVASNTLDVLLEKSGRLVGTKTGAARPLKDGARVRVHLCSANAAARVHLLDRGPLQPGGCALAQIRCETSLFAFAGDRFIVRDWPEQATLAGGLVLDADGSPRRFRIAASRVFLEQRAQKPGEIRALVQSQLARDGASRRGTLLVKSRFSAAEISDALASLAAQKSALITGDLALDPALWREIRQAAVEAIDAEHRAHPERPGLELSKLRKAVENQLPFTEVFDALLADLCANEFAQVGVAIRRASHRPALPPHLQAAGVKVRAALAAKPLEPPSRKELAPDALAQQALRFLLLTGEATELSEDLVFSAVGYARAMELVKKFLSERASATAGELRQALGTSRRIVIPLLERLDKEGVTRREGDKRCLRK